MGEVLWSCLAFGETVFRDVVNTGKRLLEGCIDVKSVYPKEVAGRLFSGVGSLVSLASCVGTSNYHKGILDILMTPWHQGWRCLSPHSLLLVSVMPFQSHSGKTLPLEATAPAAPVVFVQCLRGFSCWCSSIVFHFSMYHNESLINHNKSIWIWIIFIRIKARKRIRKYRKWLNMIEHANTCIQTQLTGKSMSIGSLRMSWDSDTCLKICENSLTISLERSQGRQENSYAFLCNIVSHFRTCSYGFNDGFHSVPAAFCGFSMRFSLFLQGPVPAAFVWDFAGDSTSDQTALNVRKETAPCDSCFEC